jgi:hypothetical protein
MNVSMNEGIGIALDDADKFELQPNLYEFFPMHDDKHLISSPGRYSDKLAVLNPIESGNEIGILSIAGPQKCVEFMDSMKPGTILKSGPFEKVIRLHVEGKGSCRDLNLPLYVVFPVQLSPAY